MKPLAPSMLLLAICAFSQGAMAQSTEQSTTEKTARQSATVDPKATAKKHVDDAVGVVKRMESDSRIKTVLKNAHGVFIVPTYGRAALGVGGQGGAGVLLVKQSSGSWSDPAFYNMGGISIGAQAGIEGGPIAFVLNNIKAVDRFTDKNNFSLSADTGLTVLNWSKMAGGSSGPGDIVAWAGTKGLFGNVVTLGANDIRFNQRLTDAYYNQKATVAEVMEGKLSNPESGELKKTLAAVTSGSASGSSSGK